MGVTDHTIPKLNEIADGLITRLGRITAWLNVLLALVIILQVTLRYAFGMGLVSLEEIQWHLYAVLIMMGLSYDVVLDAHVRLDLFHRNFSQSTKEIVELLGMLFLALPFTIILFIHGIDFVATSIRVNEASTSPLGLPFRWIVKSIIPISMFLLGLAQISRVVRAAAFIWAGKRQEGSREH